MSRLEWSRYAGEEVEHAIAMFIACEDPFAARIQPSRGDGGVDVLSTAGSHVTVYQIKSFTKSLTNNQKKQVLESLDRLKNDSRWAEWNVDSWHLVTPSDPTPEQINWLKEACEARGLENWTWDGLVQCDAWAAQFPMVTDYYFQNNQDHINRVVMQFMQVLRGPGEEELSFPADGISTIQRLSNMVQLLEDQDPHYKYDISIAEHQEKDFNSAGLGPGIHAQDVVFSHTSVVGGKRIKVDIRPKTMMSAALRPISATMKFMVREGSREQQSIENFLIYGSPFEIADDLVNVSIDAPAGLGCEDSPSRVQIGNAGGLSREQPEFTITIINANRELLAELEMRRVSVTTGHRKDATGDPIGIEGVFRDYRSIVEIRVSHRIGTRTPKMQFKIDFSNSHLAVDIVPTVRFISAFSDAAFLNIRPRFAPRLDHHNMRLPVRQFTEAHRLKAYSTILDATLILQKHATFGVDFPSGLVEHDEAIRFLAQIKKLREGAELSIDSEHAEYGAQLETARLLEDGRIAVCRPIGLPECFGNIVTPTELRFRPTGTNVLGPDGKLKSISMPLMDPMIAWRNV